MFRERGSTQTKGRSTQTNEYWVYFWAKRRSEKIPPGLTTTSGPRAVGVVVAAVAVGVGVGVGVVAVVVIVVVCVTAAVVSVVVVCYCVCCCVC